MNLAKFEYFGFGVSDELKFTPPELRQLVSSILHQTPEKRWIIIHHGETEFQIGKDKTDVLHLVQITCNGNMRVMQADLPFKWMISSTPPPNLA